MLGAGFSRVHITPPVGAPLAGFAAREGVSTGVHDDLYARALVLTNEKATVALVSVDVLALSKEFVRLVRARIQERTSIAPDSIMIASTHTHAGPVTITTFFNPDESVDSGYMEELAQAIVQCVSTAWQERFPARVGVGAGRVEGVGVNRRTPDQRPVDEEIGIIKVEDEAQRTRAVFINHACHPTVLGPDNLLITGDFPAYAIETIESTLGEGSFAMFVNGTQGNISMGHSSELSAIGVVTPGRTFERAAELGQRLAGGALEALPAIQTSNTLALDSASVIVNLPLKQYPRVEQTEQSLREADEHLSQLASHPNDGKEFRRAKSEHLYASITNFYAKETSALPDGVLPIELQAVRVADAVFMAVPAEVFVEIGLRIKQIAPHKTFIVGLANDYIGYLPTAEAHAAGGYEVVSAKCRPEAADILIDKLVNLEEKLFTDEESA